MLDLDHLFPPFGQAAAIRKVRAAERGWNTHPLRVPLAYAIDSDWQPHAEFASGQQELVASLIRTWTNELGCRLIKELWTGAKTAIHFAFEWHAGAGNWIRSSRSKKGKFGANDLLKLRLACVSGLPIDEPGRMMRWARSDPRAADHSGPFRFSSLIVGELKSKRRPE
ncbi:DUF1348 family protein [Bradyrhizobium sp.]|jgi:nuclear transport factor 2 (NTF2) superfamily protein|uniref:DUF1348 family protein n=1 Tax=Bradyrhizobium sp. TaxID=376 RepID=UPI003D147886